MNACKFYLVINKTISTVNFRFSYEEETGRRSILELLAGIFNAFPTDILVEHAGYFFIPLVMMLVNDESGLCRKMAAAAVKLLIVKTDADTRSELFDIVLTWSNHEKVEHDLIFDYFLINKRLMKLDQPGFYFLYSSLYLTLW